ncbi:hypothetical protein [Micromonospora sp. NBRC 101691]|uniref:hypothetical protein n=1 Tax=Micromonospora sp. NBRC 101691 TaxID=3032198 RepID=UPI00255484F9|nr:hypothetical protein [Micromonospora sp. NBRC 101691]
MTLRQFLFIAALLTAASIAGSGSRPHAPVGPAEPIGPVVDEVIDLHGLAGVEFGDSQRELAERGMLQETAESCGPTLVGHETASPVFYDDRLVLLWVSAPVRTPEGVTVGTPLGELRSRFPSLTRLDAPEGTYRFDGLLAQRGDRAYLFLHDGRTVRKTIAGYADYAERLFDEGHGPC